MKLKIISRRSALAAAAAATLAATFVSAPAGAESTHGVVVKIGGIPWFNAMEVGIKARAKELGWDAWMVGPTSADPAAAGTRRGGSHRSGRRCDRGSSRTMPRCWNRCSPAPANQGILVITHESPRSEECRLELRARLFDRLRRGSRKLLAEKMGGEGQYAVYVGSLTVPPPQRGGRDAAIAWLAENHPGMVKVADRFGVAESVDDSRATALDPHARPSRSRRLPRVRQPRADRRRAGGAGAAQDRQGCTCSGPFSPGQGRRLVHDGVLTGGFMWNPMEAGRVFVTMGRSP